MWKKHHKNFAEKLHSRTCILVRENRSGEQPVGRITDKLREKTGETLVEVVASIFILLIMFAILEGAISYSNTSMQRNEEIRENNAEILQNLQSTTTTTGDRKSLEFHAVSSDLTQLGDQVFTIDVTLDEKEISYNIDGESEETTFYLFGNGSDSSTTPDSDTASENGGGAP